MSSRTLNIWTTDDRRYAVSVARALGGALLFSLPILMTMETWQLGSSMDRLRLALLLVLMLPLLIGLAFYLGFEDSTGLPDAALDALVAIAVASLLAIVIFYVFGVLDAQTDPGEWVGRVALQSVTGSIGALLAQSQFGRSHEANGKRRESDVYGEYFFMAAGALFLSANIAPTEEVLRIAYMLSPWDALALIALSLLVMHAFVYAVEFKGQHVRGHDVTFLSEFMRFTLVGYLIAVVISAYLCWTFGHLDGLPTAEIINVSIVLGFPGAVGAAAARLVL